MPSYKVIKQGFDGRLYTPDGKRPVLHRDEPYPFKKGTKVENVPPWLERMNENPVSTESTVALGPTVKELKDQLTELNVEFKGNATKAVLIELLDTANTAAQIESDKKDIAEASFMGEGEKSNAVETL